MFPDCLLRRSLATLLLVAGAGCATPPPAPELGAAALAAELARRPVVLLGEIHDNPLHHQVRAEALRRLLATGARPALAFEQIDRDRQAAVDAARLGPGGVSERADRVIGAAGPGGWDWAQYRPFIVLALEHELPIVAANLSRPDAIRVIRAGYEALFSADEQAALGLLEIPAAVLQAQQQAVIDGHCGQLPAERVPAMVRAQIARDATLARAIAPYASRGVVLLTGNGHARRDLGVPRYLPPALRGQVQAIGLIERADGAAGGEEAGAFDAVFVSPPHPRPDPCERVRGSAATAPPAPRVPAAAAGAGAALPPGASDPRRPDPR